MDENELAVTDSTEAELTEENVNVFRRGVKDDPHRRQMVQHRLWMESVQHEYPLPYDHYNVGVYIRFFNQTQYSDEEYLNKHKQWFMDDISLCKRWNLVGFYIDKGSKAPHMEFSPEWCRLLEDCLCGKVNLIVTQKAGNVSEDPDELNFISRILATQKKPVGIYFISEDIFTLASYYRDDLTDRKLFPNDWKILPEDEADLLLPDEDSRGSRLPGKAD